MFPDPIHSERRSTDGSSEIILDVPSPAQLIEQIAPRYHEASLAQKNRLLDTFVGLTGSARKYAIHLLNDVPEGAHMILRPRLRWLLKISVRENAISELFDSSSFWEKS